MSVSQNKIFRRILSALAIIVAIYIIALTALSIYISSHKEKIISSVQDAVAKNLNGEAKIQNIDITVWSSFPKIGIKITNISISDSVYHKPVLKMHEIIARAGIFDVLGNTIAISSVEMNDGFVHIFTDSSGYTNSYLLSPKKNAEEKKGKKLFIENIIFKNVQLLSESVAADKKFEIRFERMNADISQRNDSIIDIEMNEKALVKGLGFNLVKGSYINNQTLEADWVIHLNTKNISLAINKTIAQINDHPFNIDAAFYLKDSSHFLLNVSTNRLAFESAEQLVPANILRVLNRFTISEPLDILATVKGPLAAGTTPLVNVIWSVKNTDFSAQVINFKQCSFKGLFTNQIEKTLPLNDENSEILLSNFSGNLGAINLLSKNIIVKDLTKPSLALVMQSDCSFPQLDTTLSLNTVRFVSGNASLKIFYDGPLINDISIIDKLNLDLAFSNGVIEYVPRNFMINNCNGDVLISDDNLRGGNFDCDFKQTHFKINVTGTQLSGFSYNTKDKANIYCSVTSSSANLADFVYLFSPKTKVQDKTLNRQSFAGIALQLDNIFQNGNLYASVNADKVFLDNFSATNINAKLLFEDKDWEIQNASFNQSGGTFNFKASIAGTENDYQKVNVSYNIDNADAKKVFYSFDNFGQTGLTQNNLKGNLTSNGNITMNIGSNGKLIKRSLNGNVFFSVKNGALINYKPLVDINASFLKNRDLSNIQFAELKDNLDISGAEIYINRMEIASTAFRCFVEGIYSFGDKTDISIQIPLKNLKKPTEDNPKNNGVSAKTGASIYLRGTTDKDGKIVFNVDVFRKFRGDDYKKYKKD